MHRVLGATDEAMIYDIETMKRLGFNMLRKHIKVELDRWYYHCDRLGMIVWQDFVNGGAKYKDLFIMTTICALIGYLNSISKYEIYGPWHIETVFTAVLFYFLGYIFMKNIHLKNIFL